jgi:hypothetical protein
MSVSELDSQTFLERWALYISARGPLSSIPAVLVPLALAVAVAVTDRSATISLVLAFVWLAFVFAFDEFERLGFRRLLARRDAEIERIRSDDANKSPAGLAFVAPGWFRDPTGRHAHRYWDGARWSAYVADGGVQAQDPQ